MDKFDALLGDVLDLFAAVFINLVFECFCSEIISSYGIYDDILK